MLNVIHLIMLALRGYRVIGTVNGRLKIRTPYYLDDGDQDVVVALCNHKKR